MRTHVGWIPDQLQRLIATSEESRQEFNLSQLRVGEIQVALINTPPGDCKQGRLVSSYVFQLLKVAAALFTFCEINQFTRVCR